MEETSKQLPIVINKMDEAVTPINGPTSPVIWNNDLFDNVSDGQISDLSMSDKGGTIDNQPKTFKNLLQAKKRLQAFSVHKQSPLPTSPLAKKDKEMDKNADKKPLKKPIYPNEKAKAVIMEIEEMKRNEQAYLESLKRSFRKRSRSQSSERFRNKKSRNYRRDKHSKTPEKKKRSTNKLVKIYPRNWQEFRDSHLDFEAIRNFDFNPSKGNNELVKQLLFESPSLVINSITCRTINEKNKTIPFDFIRYTKTKPVLSYSINHVKFREERFLTRKEVLKVASKSTNLILEKLFTNSVIGFKENLIKSKSRQWFPKQWNQLNDDDCKLLENSIGLSYLQDYSGGEDEDLQQNNDKDKMKRKKKKEFNKTKLKQSKKNKKKKKKKHKKINENKQKSKSKTNDKKQPIKVLKIDENVKEMRKDVGEEEKNKKSDELKLAEEVKIDQFEIETKIKSNGGGKEEKSPDTDEYHSQWESDNEITTTTATMTSPKKLKQNRSWESDEELFDRSKNWQNDQKSYENLEIPLTINFSRKIVDFNNLIDPENDIKLLEKEVETISEERKKLQLKIMEAKNNNNESEPNLLENEYKEFIKAVNDTTTTTATPPPTTNDNETSSSYSSTSTTTTVTTSSSDEDTIKKKKKKSGGGGGDGDDGFDEFLPKPVPSPKEKNFNFALPNKKLMNQLNLDSDEERGEAVKGKSKEDRKMRKRSPRRDRKYHNKRHDDSSRYRRRSPICRKRKYPSPLRRSPIRKTRKRSPTPNKYPNNSPLDGFKCSVADSTISDDMLQQQQQQSSPNYRTSPSPKRISLDDRINQVLGLEKNEQRYDYYSQNYVYNQNFNIAPPPPPPLPLEQQKTKIVQIGNILQVVPNEELQPPIQHHQQQENGQKILQVGNMLQIVPGNITTITTNEKQLAEDLIQQKNYERKLEREKRRLEREKRRKEKELKRKEKEKRKQLKLKLKTENMIKKALKLETDKMTILTNDDENDEKIPSIIINNTQQQQEQQPWKSILVNVKERGKLDLKKSVQFADGIKPGEGTSPSGGEELSSPPPLNLPPPTKKTQKKTKKLQKKKIKVKVIKKPISNDIDDDIDYLLPPPSPPPGSPPPHIFPSRVKILNNLHHQQMLMQNQYFRPPPPPPLPPQPSHHHHHHHQMMLGHPRLPPPPSATVFPPAPPHQVFLPQSSLAHHINDVHGVPLHHMGAPPHH